MKRFLGFVKKEFLHIFRDFRTLIILFGIPTAQILIFGFVVSTDIKDAPVAFLDFSKDEITQKISDKMCSSGFFRRVDNLQSYDEIDKVFKKGKVKAVIVFGQNFGRDLISRGKCNDQHNRRWLRAKYCYPDNQLYHSYCDRFQQGATPECRQPVIFLSSRK